MNLLALRVMEFKGDDELAGQQQQAKEPMFYSDGTAEIQVVLCGKDETVYVRFNIADLVRMRSEAGEVEEAPEA